MIIIGTDFHPEFQQIACVDTDTGELQEKRLAHREEAEQFYRDLVAARSRCVLVWRPAGCPSPVITVASAKLSFQIPDVSAIG